MYRPPDATGTPGRDDGGPPGAGFDPYATRTEWADGRVTEGPAPTPPAWQQPARPVRRRRRFGVLVAVAVILVCVAPGVLFKVIGGMMSRGAATTGAGHHSGGGTDGPLRQADYHDWHFKLDTVKLDATKTGGRDLRSCTPVEQHRALTAQGCRSGIELDYRTAGDRVRLEQLVLLFDTAAHAKKAGHDLTGSQLTVRRSMLHPHTAAVMAQQTTDRYLVVTIGTAAKPADDKKRDTFIHYRGADMAAALIWRD